MDDDDEEVLLGFGTNLPAGVAAGTVKETVVRITDDDAPEVKVSFGADQYTAGEGGTVEVAVTLDEDPERTVVIPITATGQGGATSSDYSGVPANVTFDSGDTEKSFTFTATHDTVDDDGERVKLAFGTLPSDVSAGTVKETVVSITDDDDPEVKVSFGADRYTVAEGGDVTVTVDLDEDPERTVVIPLARENLGETSDSDYSGVPESVTFGSGDTSRTFTVAAVDDKLRDSGEELKLTFGTLPSGVSEGSPKEARVTITDSQVQGELTVGFGLGAITVAEGGTAQVTVSLSEAPGSDVTIPLTATGQDGATSSDYSGVPESVTFESSDTEQTFTFTAVDDTVDDDGESVLLAFGTLPSGVLAGTVKETLVSITDDDLPASLTVNFGADRYTVAEGGTVEVTVTLDDDPERTVVIPVTAAGQDGATSSDYSGVPQNVTFESGDTEKSFTFTATYDTVDDDDEEVLITFGTLPTGVSAGTVKETVVSITDDDDPQVEVNFRRAIHDVAEGDDRTVTVKLTADPERTVVVPLTATGQDGATSADYSVPASVTFESGETTRDVTFTATDDAVDDDGEKVLLEFGTLPDGVTPGTVPTSTVSIIDDDAPASVAVSWAQDTYTVAEGGAVTVTAELDDDPEKTVVVPIARTDQGGASSGDYSGVPATITFESGDTSKSFTFTAADDALDDDGESVQLAFGPTLPAGVTQGTPAGTVVRITDDDDPEVKVSYGLAEYTAAEGGSAIVTVELDADPERTVVIPVTHTARAGATGADYFGVPANVTFDSGDTEQTFTLSATDDTVDDDDEEVLLGFGANLPSGVAAGTVKETVVRITDDDAPDDVRVSFGTAAYTVAEGGDVTVTVGLDVGPERTVTIPLTATDQDGATSADYSGVPDSVTFDSGDTEKSFTFTATHDTVDDDGESVKLAFGTLLTGITAGTVKETVVRITDDDDPEVKVSFARSSYTVPEGATVSVVVELDADPERSVTIPITATNEGGATSADYSVPDSVTFEIGETTKDITFTAEMDDVDDDGESVQLAFGTSLPTGVTQGTPSTTTVSITDDDLAKDRLMSLVVAPRDIDGFDPEVTDYMVGVASTVTQATITATPAYEDATVAIDGTAVTAGSAHAVDLSAGLNTFEVVVTSADNDQATYTVYIGRGTTDQGGWKAGDDLDTLRAAGNTEPSGIWSNGTTIWIADVSTAKLYAYSQADGARDGDKDIALGGAMMAPTGVWSDGATIWVIGPVEMTLFAYTLGSGARDPDSDISLGSDLMLPVDMWSDGVTMWVLDSLVDKLYAYTLSGGARDTDKDIDLAGEDAAPLGVWSNGTTIWVTDRGDRKVYAFNFSGEQVTGHDIDLHSRNADAGAIWGNDDTLWVANDINDVSSPFNRVFTYNNVPVTVTFGQSSYTVAESDDTSTTEVAENAVQVTMTLSADPKRQVVAPITATRQGTVTGADYSGVPANLTFESGETEKSFTFTATHDTLDDDDESVQLTFGMLPPGVTGGTNSEAVVTIIDDDIGVSFERMGYETTEGESVDVKVTLSSPATREVTIQLDTDKEGGASDDDYSGVGDSITFPSSDTETNIRFTAVDDEFDDDGEQVRLRFGTLPTGLVPGPHVEATITITDNDMPTDRLMSLVVAPRDIDGFDPEVTGYMVGVASTVTQATITATPYRPDDTVTIDGTTVTGGSAHTVDLSVGLNTFAVVVDSAITQVQSTYTVYIGRGTAVQGGWKAGDDLDTLRSPGNTSPTGAWSNGVTMWIADSNDGKLYAYTLADSARDSDKDITLDSNNSNPVGIWSDDTTIWVAELMPTERKVYAYTLADGARDSDKDITLRGDNTTSWGVWSDGTTMWVVDWNADEVYAYTLADDARDADQDIALHGDNTSPRGIWSDGTTIWVVDSIGAKLYPYALSDGVRVEGYDIGLHSSNAGAGGIWANDDTAWVVNSATEDGSPFDRVFTYNNIPVEVSFQSARYTVAESGSVTVKVTLGADPKRTVVIPLTATDQDGATAADYSGVPESLTFVSGETTKDITFTAEMDDVDDDGESVLIGFGTTLPAGVTTGSPSAATVTIDDDDDPQVEVNFYRSIYDVAEGGNVTITVNLSADPERTVVVPLTATDQDGATSADYAAIPASVTFDPGDTSKTFTFSATDDAIDDDGESVLLEFGTLPDGVTLGTVPTSAVSITDDDAPATVTVSFGADRYSATEGGDDAVVTVILGSPAQRQVEIPLTANGRDGATEDDWSGVPETVTFNTGDTSKSFTVTAFDDNVEDNGEMVELGFGTLPAGFAPGSPSTARITLMNDDGIETTGQNRVCTEGEITVGGQTDRWIWRITDSDYWDEYTIDLMGLHSNKGTLRDPHIVYITKIYTHDGFYPPAGSASGGFPSYGINDDGVGWDSSSQLRFRNKKGSYSYFPGKEPELDTGYYTALVGANPFGDGANGLGSYTLCIEGPGSISAVDQPERRIVVSAAHVDVSDGEPAQFSIKLGARPTGPVEVFMTKFEPASDSQYVVEPLMHSFTVGNWDIPQVATVRRKADYATPKDDGFAIHYWGKGGGYHKAFEFIEVYDRVPRWMTLRSTYDPEPDLTDQVAEAQKQNSPATGGPGIQGVARAGETLTATTSGIRDDDGLDNAVFAHQWVRSELGAESGTDIAGAMSPSYVVTSEDEGKAITVRVTFTDDAGNGESVISFAVVVATALPQTRAPDPPGAPEVSAHDSTSLAVSWTEPASDGGSAITGYKLQWKEAAGSWETPEDVSEAAATGTSHTITGLADGAEYAVRVLAINDNGESLPSEDGSGTPRETVPPELSEVSVDGAALTLAFSEDLTETPLPAVNTFRVNVGEDTRGVDSLEISGSTVTLTLASSVTSSDEVTVSYTVPTDAAAARLKDLSDNPAESFADQAVTNNTAAAQRRSRQQQENSPATGSPTISGTAQVGETLTTSTTDISDTDGLTKVSYAYQWTANDGTSDSDIADATTSTYTLVPSDVGKTIKVKVTFTDDAGNGESLPSAATAAVAAAVPGAPASLRVSVNDTGKLDLSWEAPETDGGSAVIGYKVQWKEAVDSWDTPADVSEAAVTVTSHTITGLTDGVEYTFRMIAVNLEGDSSASEDESGTPRETTAPTVSSASVDGATLTLTFNEALDGNSEPAATAFTVTVSGNARAVESVDVIGGAVTLTLASAVSSEDTVTVSYTAPASESAERLRDEVGNAAASFAGQSVTNDTAPAAPAETRVPDAPNAPDVSAHDSTSLAVSWTEPASDGGSAITGYKLQWKEAADSWDTPADVSEAAVTVTSHTITGLTGGVEYTVRVSAVNSVGDGAPSPEATGTPIAGDSDRGTKGAQGTPAEGSPAVTGEPTVGETLRADNSGISDKDGMKRAVFTYQWVAGGADIDGATGASYTLTDDEEGLVVQVWVSFTDDAGNPEAVTSVGTAAVSPANTPASGVPAITGILRDGETLAADTSGISDEDRMDNAVFTYRWMAGGVDIDGATGSSYTLTAEEVGAAISVWVSFTDDAGNPEAVTSAFTEAVAPKPPLTAQFLDTPGSHDGQSEFTFELRFSETPRRGFSYKTLLDHAFTVTGGEVVRARRLEPGQNVRWEIPVSPDSNAAVTIVLPATTDCEAEGAICTGDGRPLSERVELTVSGPNG